MTEWLPLIGLVLSGAAVGWMARTSQRALAQAREARHERDVARVFAFAAVQRLADALPCDICGQPYRDGEQAIARLAPGRAGAVFAHGICLAPMPDADRAF